MVNRVARGAVSIELDKPRLLFYNLAAMKVLKEVHGIKMSRIQEAMTEADGDPNYDNIAILISVGLMHEDAGATPEWVLENISVPALLESMPQIYTAMGNAVGNGQEGTVAPPKAVKAK